jgi:hypothetical protein
MQLPIGEGWVVVFVCVLRVFVWWFGVCVLFCVFCGAKLLIGAGWGLLCGAVLSEWAMLEPDCIALSLLFNAVH